MSPRSTDDPSLPNAHASTSRSCDSIHTTPYARKKQIDATKSAYIKNIDRPSFLSVRVMRFMADSLN